MPGLEVEAILRAGDHDPGRLNLHRYARRGRLDIDDDGVLHINQIVEAIAEHDLVAPARRPRSGWHRPR